MVLLSAQLSKSRLPADYAAWLQMTASQLPGRQSWCEWTPATVAALQRLGLHMNA